MDRTPLSTLLGERRQQGHDVHFEVPEDWLQGRTSFGGLVSVFGVQAMRDVASGGWPGDVSLRAMQTNFIAPVQAGHLKLSVAVLREGRNVRQVQATLLQDNITAALFVGVFGAERESVVPQRLPRRPAAAKAVDDIPVHAPPPGVRPQFTAHFDMRWAEGAPPYSGEEDWDASIHIRLRDEDAAAIGPELMTVMMADVSPTPVLSQFSKPTPASSVSWALEMRPLARSEPLDGWWRADNRAICASGGYVNQQSMLWAPSGALAALAYQVVTVYG